MKNIPNDAHKEIYDKLDYFQYIKDPKLGSLIMNNFHKSIDILEVQNYIKEIFSEDIYV